MWLKPVFPPAGSVTETRYSYVFMNFIYEIDYEVSAKEITIDLILVEENAKNFSPNSFSVNIFSWTFATFYSVPSLSELIAMPEPPVS